eukprot:9467801-Pyramimonas_sp.AAC.1
MAVRRQLAAAEAALEVFIGDADVAQPCSLCCSAWRPLGWRSCGGGMSPSMPMPSGSAWRRRTQPRFAN